MFTAHTPCQIDPNDLEGFAVIGGGTEATRNQLLSQEYSKDESLQSVLYDVFCAKCAAEVIQGVGVEWNWRLLLPNEKPRELPKTIDDLIDRLWLEKTRSPFARPLAKSERAPEGWENTLNEYAEKVLGAAPKRSTSRKSKGQP
jgi:hypothetical protein